MDVLRRIGVSAAIACGVFLGVLLAMSWHSNPPAADRWSEIRPGMTQAEVIARLGPPDATTERIHPCDLYDLHPREGLEGSIEYQAGKVLSVDPPDGGSWTSEANRRFVLARFPDAAQLLGFYGLATMCAVSLIPLGMTRGWLSWPLYYPVITIVWAMLYESVQTAGWRFDLIFLSPGYALVATAWLVRVIVVARRRTIVLP